MKISDETADTPSANDGDLIMLKSEDQGPTCGAEERRS